MVISNADLRSVAAPAPSAELAALNTFLLKHFSEVREDIRALRSDIRSCKQEVAELKGALATNTKLSGIDMRMHSLEAKFSGLRTTNELELVAMNLRVDLNERDRQATSYDVEITNLVEEVGESAPRLVFQVAAKLGLALTDTDVISAERVGKYEPGVVIGEERPRCLLIRFARRAVKDQFLQAARDRHITWAGGWYRIACRGY